MELKDILSKSYKNKKVFVTGHTGFKGAWLILLLHKLGAEVKGYALQPEERSLYNDISGDNFCESIIGDIRNQSNLIKELHAFQPDYVFHLAAQPLVLASYEHPVYTYETNVMGTVYLLDAIRQLEKKCHIVMITTDKVYENKEWLYPYRETDRLGGFDPYSSSKASSEIAIASFIKSFFPVEQYNQHQKAVAVVRAGNVIGGGDWAANRIIPDIVKALSNEETINVRNPRAVRPWQHVLEALIGYLQIGKKLSEEDDIAVWASAWNFGPLYDEFVDVETLVQNAVEIWGSGNYEAVEVKQPHEAKLLRLDCSKASNLLGWQPQKNASEAINFTIQWYKAVLQEKIPASDYTNQQIDEYLG
ncbi:CDP-glucose 4,6-dehydratase [Flammeovirga yaeyamensis]|uniref:CDP-glucose 4,6-dehydratase n=2 Tax=Flammeovirga yaeyamensis TaxID=367791 RepID=A0AAX1NCZ9_9BACT|nr:CDP-glucose 4,6-dehydratase [Flammeovirga yaeyamensis]MBB3696332.1 CDP-glucose 4,6-dehydratase [Flammeovirga yaeyamensis]NMF35011.1 CDP-glucose 4,6-dehydratase [Flammeovirga yaeyamensis]QWG03982.1 CDP-glucose 4,6-dehydratase [Flammeovirga yaeyamensis]